MATKSESGKPKSIVDRVKLRPIHTRVRERHAGDPKGAVIHTRGQIRQVDGFFLQGEDGHGSVLRQDLPTSMGGRGRVPSALAYMLMGVGF